MKHVFFFALLCSFTAQAQDPDFWIGSWNVTPRWDASERNVWPVRGMLNPVPAPPRIDATLLNCLSDSILPRARWLGLNLVGVNIRADEESTTHDHVEPGNNAWNNNAVEEVCRSADALNLQVLVRDAQVERRFMGERIMLHPESTDDFTTHGNYTPDDRNEFRQFVLPGSPFTTTLAQRVGGLNCIYMQNDAGTVSGMTVDRIQEMSAYLAGDPQDPHRLSGLYHVSVIVLPRTDPGFPLPNDDGTPVLNVTISYTDPATGYEEHVFPLEGRQLWEDVSGSRVPLTGVHEIVLGEIEVRQTNGSP